MAATAAEVMKWPRGNLILSAYEPLTSCLAAAFLFLVIPCESGSLYDTIDFGKPPTSSADVRLYGRSSESEERRPTRVVRPPGSALTFAVGYTRLDKCRSSHTSMNTHNQTSQSPANSTNSRGVRPSVPIPRNLSRGRIPSNSQPAATPAFTPPTIVPTLSSNVLPNAFGTVGYQLPFAHMPQPYPYVVFGLCDVFLVLIL